MDYFLHVNNSCVKIILLVNFYISSFLESSGVIIKQELK